MSRWSPLRSVLLATSALVPLGLAPALANPLAPNVVGGAATVTGTGTSNVTVNQSTGRAIINWNSFNIGAGETTRFVQPNANSVALNRVTGALGPSQLYGTLTANGRVFLVNPDGILVGRGAVIDTAGFLATTHDITNENFMAGRYHFNIPGRPDASVVNEGTINAHSHGFAALVAPGVRNSGTITARFGKIGLAAGNTFSLDLYGDQLITLAVGDSIGATVRDVATGQPLNALIKNEGKLKATGGRVELTATSARAVVDSVINNSGVIEARSVGHRNGKIVLGGPTAATKLAGAPTQTVKVSGTLSTASKKGKGGTIQVTGEAIEIRAASFDASGATGGGKVLIGGDTGGGYGHWAVAEIPQAALEAGAIPTATTVSIDAATTINASATSVGDGGKVIVWADGTTTFAGTISARGGDNRGDGGFVEVSGKQTLNFAGGVDTRAPFGAAGTLLLDPANVTIGPGGPATGGGPQEFNGDQNTDTFLSVSTLLAALNSGNVIVATATTGTGVDGDIIVADSFSWGTGGSSSSSLTLNAFRHIIINNGVTITNSGTGNFNLRAGITGNGVGNVSFPGAPGVQISSTGGGNVNVYYNPAIFGTPDFNTSRVSVTGGGKLTPYMLVNNFTQLQNMVDPGGDAILGSYALSQNISGGVFATRTYTFRGDFDGQNYTISGLIINGPGIFQANSGTIRNVTLSGVTVNATGNNQVVGFVAGQNNATGTIDHVTTGGFLSGGSFSGVVAGGLVGMNAGAISDSRSSANIASAGLGITLGGLVGFNQAGATILDSLASGNVTATASVPSFTGTCTQSCPFVTAGGLVGQNSGTIGTFAGSPAASASGIVSVGSNAVGGGLVGSNDGIILNTFATGAVRGASGVDGGDFNNQTLLGGLVGFNRGLVGLSYATGDVGSITADRLRLGGLVAENSGYIALSYATGNVRARNSSEAGGLVGSGNADSCFGCNMGDGAIFSNLNLIVSSYATGAVTVGSSSIAGGFAASGSIIIDGHASGAVRGGANSILGGFAGVHAVGGLIQQSTATGRVTATGANSWLGGFIGYNGGMIANSTATGAVSGTSDSILAGFSAINIGLISQSDAFGSVVGSGANNFIGGFGGVNFGTIDSVLAAGALAGGANSTIGGVVAANATFTNFPGGLLPLSSFPSGTLTNSAATGAAGAHPPVGVTNPTTLPAYPSIVATCDDVMCEVFNRGILGGPSDSFIPNSVLAPPDLWQPLDRLERLDSPNALIQLTPPSDSTPGTGAPSTAPPGTPPRSLAPPRPLRPVAGVDGELRSNIPPIGETRFLNNEVVLQVLLNTPPGTVQQIAQQLGLTLVTSQDLTSLGRTAIRFRITNGRSVRDIIRALEANRIVAVAQPNYQYHLVQAPAAVAPFTASRGDPAQYSMGKLRLDEAHRVASGRNITVAVIDSEVDREHVELAGTISERYDATDSDSQAHSHGTAMAGAIVSRDRLLGVAPGARILAVRAFSETQSSAESTSFTILKGIEWAVSQGARVINMSFAGPYDPTLERALKDAADKGVILVAASGNAGPKSPPLWPGADPNVIAVTATDSSDKLFRQANRGPYVSVASPGVEILAPAPQAGYQMSTGTSIATAHVSGVIALMLERDPTLTPRDVRLILESTAIDLGPKGRDTQFGWGLVNPSRALAMVDERKRRSGAAPPPPIQR